MKVAEYAGYLLELSKCDVNDHFHAWLSRPTRCIVGYGKAPTEVEAICLAVKDAEGEGPPDFLATLERCALNYLKVRPFCGGTR